MDASSLTPAQRRVADELLDLGKAAPRPVWDAGLADELRSFLDVELTPLADALTAEGTAELFVSKRALAQVLSCEAHHVADVDGGFEWTARTAQGVVAHKAVELLVMHRTEPVPLDLVDAALDRLAGDEHDGGPALFLRSASADDLAELRAGANDRVLKFLECWPPLDRRWLPRTESRIRAAVCGDRVVLSGKVDLAFGRAQGLTARSVIVDLKTGGQYASHLDDLRFYALIETLRIGVPPFRVASYYLDRGRFVYEDVTRELLDLAARRVVEAVGRLAELALRRREPAVTPCPACAWCRLRSNCEGALRWRTGSPSGDDDDLSFGPDA